MADACLPAGSPGSGGEGRRRGRERRTGLMYVRTDLKWCFMLYCRGGASFELEVCYYYYDAKQMVHLQPNSTSFADKLLSFCQVHLPPLVPYISCS
jgi:hypothetical protein